FMNRLHDIQRDFSRFVLAGAKTTPKGIRRNGFAVDDRLSIYRNNLKAGLTECLRNVYPVINSLVGEAFFDRLTWDYINVYPPRVASLLDYGAELADFSKDYPGLQKLPYLQDMARLEWAWHQAHFGADGGPLNLAELARLDSETKQRIGLKLHPTAHLIASEFPLARIWQANRAKDDSLINLDAGGCRLLVYRPDKQVQLHELAGYDFAFLQALNEGMNLVEASVAAFNQYPNFDVLQVLQRWLLCSLLVDIVIH
ncbi:MAG: HvfC/BufC N-terminal domain-containing protein, partial [Gammaproteobacteria bacterium]